MTDLSNGPAAGVCGVWIEVVKATIHNDMWDGATEAQKAEILRWIASFLDRVS